MILIVLQVGMSSAVLTGQTVVHGRITDATTLGGSDKIDRSQVLHGWLESDLYKGLTGKMIFTYKTFQPVNPDYYFAWYTDETKTTLSSDFTTSKIAFTLRYQPKAAYVLDGVKRLPEGGCRNQTQF